MRKSALDPVMSSTVQAILAVTCLEPDRAWYLSDLAKRLRRTPSTLQQPLAALVGAGILKRWQDGNRVYFQADEACPFLPELQGLLAKTVGLSDVLREELSAHADRITTAFVYGSVARGTERSTSDVDLFIIGRAGLRELSPALGRAEKRLGRPVNATIFSDEEFAARRAKRDHFVQSVLGKKKVFVLGTEHELEAACRRRPRRAARDKQAGTGRPVRRRAPKSGGRRTNGAFTR